jgi:MoaA/NifB/PqqE/SkfB family radical SAM enzyme
VNVTWRCNWRCQHCFYRFNDSLHKTIDVELSALKTEVECGMRGGMEHVVLVGYGEPTLYPKLEEFLRWCAGQGLATSMITNAATGLERLRGAFEAGLDHAHVSTHGVGSVLQTVTSDPTGYEKQLQAKQWMQEQNLPFRSNITLQQSNYQELEDVVSLDLALGVYHFVVLGFLPHYEWRTRAHEAAVHPAKLRPYIEAAAEMLLDADTLFTIRYHPLCHLSSEFWPYVVNARYVPFDPWEWNYSLQFQDVDKLWQDALTLGNSVACDQPCQDCAALLHCGGWNRTLAATLDGAGLKPIHEAPEQYQAVWDQPGGLHDLNPANKLSGTIRRLEAPSVSL